MNMEVVLKFHNMEERPKVSCYVLAQSVFGGFNVLSYSKKYDAFNVFDSNKDDHNSITSTTKRWAYLPAETENGFVSGEEEL